MPVTGLPLDDALQSMQVHLNAQKSTWSVSRVDAFPSYRVGRKGPTIALEIAAFQTDLIMVADPSLVVDYRVLMRISYFSHKLTPQNYHVDVTQMLSRIGIFLMTNPEPDGWGCTLSDGDALAFELGELPTEPAGAKLFGGSLITTLVRHGVTITMV